MVYDQDSEQIGFIGDEDFQQVKGAFFLDRGSWERPWEISLMVCPKCNNVFKE